MLQVDDFKRTLSDIAEALNAEGITWWLGASSALYVQGVAVTPKDLDIIIAIDQFDRAYTVLQALNPGPVTKGDFAGEIYYKAELVAAAFPAEIAGFKPDGSPLITVVWNGVQVTVHPLDVELEMYKKRSGKEHIVKLIQETLKGEPDAGN